RQDSGGVEDGVQGALAQPLLDVLRLAAELEPAGARGDLRVARRDRGAAQGGAGGGHRRSGGARAAGAQRGGGRARRRGQGRGGRQVREEVRGRAGGGPRGGRGAGGGGGPGGSLTDGQGAAGAWPGARGVRISHRRGRRLL